MFLWLLVLKGKHFTYFWNYIDEIISSWYIILHHIVAWHYLFTSEVLDEGQVRRINDWDLITERYGKFQAQTKMIQHSITANQCETLKDDPMWSRKHINSFLLHHSFPVLSWINHYNFTCLIPPWRNWGKNCFLPYQTMWTAAIHSISDNQQLHY